MSFLYPSIVYVQIADILSGSVTSASAVWQLYRCLEGYGTGSDRWRVRSIGISNFESERLEELLESAVIKPSVLQVECHPYY